MFRFLLLALGLAASATSAEPLVTRTFFKPASSNGHGAVMLDLEAAKVTHFRERLPATEEPRLDAAGNEVWVGNQPKAVSSRDLLYDAYFGVRVQGAQRWLSGVPVELAQSGYAPWKAGAKGGTGVLRWTQTVGPLELTQYVFSPRGFPHAGFVLAAAAKNTGAAALADVSVFSLHNFHLGFGRPGVTAELAENGETVTAATGGDLLERAFAGVVVARPLGPMSHRAAWNAATSAALSGYEVVRAGAVKDLPDVTGQTATGDGWATAFQFDFGTLAPAQEAWAAVAFAHHPDPFAGADAQAWLDAYLAGRDAQALVKDELAGWASLQGRVRVGSGLSADEEELLRHQAVMLAMAQVQDETAYLREHLSSDGEQRRTRFGPVKNAPPATLPSWVAHRGKGAVLASLPPGEWTYSWARDGAYAIAGLASLGLHAEAKDALRFFLEAEGGRFQSWNELRPYGMPPYLVSLVRYHGFGVEETDFNAFGPNLEFDGFGLFLWALRRYELDAQDTSLVDQHWELIATKVADPLVALVDPAQGLLRKDSSIWESHWNGRERAWTFTNLAAVRGLCDAASLAQRRQDATRAARYQKAALELRAAIARKLTDASGALASNAEELQAGRGYHDAAVLEAIALGLFDPNGRIARATLAGVDASLRLPGRAGWARNDDRKDHAGAVDVSPWGSEYDSAEWVFTDLRGAVALWWMNDPVRSNRLIDWVTRQSLGNGLAIAETYDESSGHYKFNAPMVGFGAGAFALALRARQDGVPEPACGAFFDESVLDGGVDAPDAGVDGGPAHDGGGPDSTDAGTSAGPPPPRCGCTHPEPTLLAALAVFVAGGLRSRAARRR